MKNTHASLSTSSVSRPQLGSPVWRGRRCSTSWTPHSPSNVNCAITLLVAPQASHSKGEKSEKAFLEFQTAHQWPACSRFHCRLNASLSHSATGQCCLFRAQATQFSCVCLSVQALQIMLTHHAQLRQSVRHVLYALTHPLLLLFPKLGLHLWTIA